MDVPASTPVRSELQFLEAAHPVVLCYSGPNALRLWPRGGQTIDRTLTAICTAVAMSLHGGKGQAESERSGKGYF